MQTGDVVTVTFPFTNLAGAKARPAAVVTQTADTYQDVVVSLISSVLPQMLNDQQMMIYPSQENNLKVPSVLKVSRIATVESSKITATIGKLDADDLAAFKKIFRSLIH